MDINTKVLLLAIFKKESDETLNDILIKLQNNSLFTLKEGKKLLKQLKLDEYINDSYLTLKGELFAKKIEEEFRI